MPLFYRKPSFSNLRAIRREPENKGLPVLDSSSARFCTMRHFIVVVFFILHILLLGCELNLVLLIACVATRCHAQEDHACSQLRAHPFGVTYKSPAITRPFFSS